MNFRIAVPLPVVIVTALYVLLVEVSTLCYLMPGRLGQQLVLFGLQHISQTVATSRRRRQAMLLPSTKSPYDTTSAIL